MTIWMGGRYGKLDRGEKKIATELPNRKLATQTTAKPMRTARHPLVLCTRI